MTDSRPEEHYLDPSSLQDLAARDSTLQIVDVRSASEFAAGHIEGAVNIPLSELAERVREIPSGAKVVTVCARGGSRSCDAAQLLRAAGFSSAQPLRGGNAGMNS